MSIRTPPTLLQLAAESLLRDQASAIAALQYLPDELFPPLFMQAYYGERFQCVKAMAQAWPYPVLPLGGLPQLSLEESFNAVLDGLDLLLAQKVRPRRCKLQVLDLRNTGANFWRMWCGASTQNHSTRPVTVHSSSPNMEHPLAPLEVFLDLTFNERDRDEMFMYIIQWAQQREGLLHLCCKTLRIAEVPFQRVRKFLDVVQLDCIQEVEVNCTWDLPTLGMFALYLGHMRNLQKLSLSFMHELTMDEEEVDDEEGEEEQQEYEEEEEEDEYNEVGEEEEMEQEEWEREQLEVEELVSLFQLFLQMRRLQHLKELNMDSPSFMRGRLYLFLRDLQIPLEKLSITNCPQLTHSDLTNLFQCPKLRQLKSLRLYCVSLEDFSPEPLQAMLEAVAPTLQDLGLDNCVMVDSQVEAILPVLSRCHQLRFFTITENNFSVGTMGKLLRHTAMLRNLDLELYPIPMECYRIQGTVNQERLALVRAELTEILRELGQPRTILLATKNCGHTEFYNVACS